MASPMTPSHVVIAYDATKDRGGHELKLTIDAVQLRGDILRAGDTIVVLGVLHKVVHPSKCSTKCPNGFYYLFSRIRSLCTLNEMKSFYSGFGKNIDLWISSPCLAIKMHKQSRLVF